MARLSVSGTCCAWPPAADDRDRVRVVLEADAGRRHVVGHDEVEALAARACRRRWPRTSSVSAAKPTRTWPGRLPRAEAGEDVGGGLEHRSAGAPASFLILPAAGADGPEVGHGGRHHDHVGVAVVVHGRLHLGGRLDRDHGRRRAATARSTVVTRVTSAPASGGLGGDGVALLARRAVGDEPHRVDRLAGAAGGDEHAQPGQVGRAEHALGGGHDGARARPGGRRRRRRRPGGRPRAPPRATPRRRSVARLSCTAGCSHISVCIAGQTTTGARVASSVAVSRSSEMPAA